MKALKRSFTSRSKSGGSSSELAADSVISTEEQEWRNSLHRDDRLLKAMQAFCNKFLSAVDSMYSASVALWEELQDLEAAGLDLAGDTGLITHLWALRSGLELVSPAVSQELKKRLQKLNELDIRNKRWKEVCLLKDSRWKAKVHYDAKLGELLKTKCDREAAGKSPTLEQNAHLSRNLGKHDAACEEYTKVSDRIQTEMRKHRALTKEDREGQGCLTDPPAFGGDVELRKLLRDVTRSAACGWFISIGAAVCQAINQAESQTKGRFDFESGRAPPAQRGMLTLPKSMEEESFEPQSGFDPQAPLNESWKVTSSVVVEELPEETHPQDEFAFMESLRKSFDSDSDGGSPVSSPGGPSGRSGQSQNRRSLPKTMPALGSSLGADECATSPQLSVASPAGCIGTDKAPATEPVILADAATTVIAEPQVSVAPHPFPTAAPAAATADPFTGDPSTADPFTADPFSADPFNDVVTASRFPATSPSDSAAPAATATSQKAAPRSDSAESAAGSFWSFAEAGAFGNDLIVYEDVVKDNVEKEDDGPSLQELRDRLAAQGFEVPAEDAAMDREELLRVLQAIAS